MSIDIEVDERPLREIYLVPFEAAVREAGVCMVMSAYNKLRGQFCSENRDLLLSVLKEEWGFEGAVVSDWFGTRSTAAVGAGLDLEMPGPASFLGPHLVDAVAGGTVSADAVRDAADRMLRLLQAARLTPTGRAPLHRGTIALARQAAAAGIVLLKNESSVLPLDPATMSRARRDRTRGGTAVPSGRRRRPRSPSPTSARRSRPSPRGPGAWTSATSPAASSRAPSPLSGRPGLHTKDGGEGIAVAYFAADEPDAEPVHRQRLHRVTPGLARHAPPEPHRGGVPGSGHHGVHPGSDGHLGLRSGRDRQSPTLRRRHAASGHRRRPTGRGLFRLGHRRGHRRGGAGRRASATR